MTRRITSPRSSGSVLSDLASLAVLGVCVGARVALDAVEPVLASLLAWSGAAKTIAGVLAEDEGGASW